MSGWSARVAQPCDNKAFKSFRCATTQSGWDLHVEAYVREELMLWACESGAQVDDPRVLLLIDPSGTVAGVAAHELRSGVTQSATAPFPIRHLQVGALSLDWQGRSDESGTRISDLLMKMLLTDIDCRRVKVARLTAIVHRANIRSKKLMMRYGFVETPAPNIDAMHMFMVTP